MHRGKPADRTRELKGPAAALASLIWSVALFRVGIRNENGVDLLRSNVAQAFEIAAMTGMSGVPDSVVQAAFGGKHNVVVPHRQRLLVAAGKAADAPKPEASEATEAGKKEKKPKAKAKPKAQATAAEASAPKKASKSKGTRPPYADTEYNIERKKYFATFLI